MPRGPKGERRPADVNRRAVLIAKIATSEVEDARQRTTARTLPRRHLMLATLAAPRAARHGGKHKMSVRKLRHYPHRATP